MSGGASHDLRLISDVSRVRTQSLKALNLDVTDTTPEELYYALRHRAVRTNKELEDKLGISVNDTPQQLMKKIVLFIESLEIPRESWVVKHSVVKQLLKKQTYQKN